MTDQGEPLMGRFSVEVSLANDEDLVRAGDGTIPAERVRRLRISGQVDPGASSLVLPQKVAKQLGVPVVGKAKVTYADRRKATRPVVQRVNLELLGRSGIFSAIVEPKREDALIGAIVLEELDLLVDCRNQRLHPRDPATIVAYLE